MEIELPRRPGSTYFTVQIPLRVLGEVAEAEWQH